MKNIILIIVFSLFSISSFAQLPDLIGEKASIKTLKKAYSQHRVESGTLLDVGSYDSMDNIYLSSEIRGFYMDMSFYLTSDRNGVIDYIQYSIISILPEHFEYLKSTVVKVHKAQYIGSNSGGANYTSTLFGISRSILFKREDNGRAYVTFALSRY